MTIEVSNVFSLISPSPREIPSSESSYRMSLPVLSTHSYLPVPHPISPTSHDYLRAEDSTGVGKRYLQNISEISDSHWSAPFRDGLPTPPNDMNGVACNHVSSTHGGKLDGFTLPPYNKVPSFSHVNSETLNGMIQRTNPQIRSSTKGSSALGPDCQKKARNASTSSLQIPSSINNSKGNLAEFAAQMTCLFWFETTGKLTAIEDRLKPTASMVSEAIPTIGFQKWVTNILSTTQVSQNVILLALLFIYRLKKSNPGVRGKRGSEYRLMTIALMLGNKFLDDNTYTNKTWAEVSGISVQEIHIMEVEFLSNVRYNLYASESEWAKWHVKLGLFADFYNTAPLETNEPAPAPPALRISPTLAPPTRAQVSPIAATKLPSPPVAETLRPSTWSLPLNGIPQLPNDEPLISSRKRPRDELNDEHPSKKIAMPSNAVVLGSTLPPSSALSGIPALPPMLTPASAPPSQNIPGSVSRLPRPHLVPSSHTLAPGIPAVVTQLPPTAGRPLPSSFNPTNWIPHIQASPGAPHNTNGVFNPAISLPDPGRHHNSPFGVTSATVSPAVSAYSVNTPQTHLSPSFFLANRNSPYRPVRSVNTLLFPPPSSSLQQQRSVPFDHMHYQPLGKSSAERKTGLLPYLHHEAWPQGTFIHPTFHTPPTYSG